MCIKQQLCAAIFSLIYIAYNVTWGLLFIFATSSKSYPEPCSKLLLWDRILYILLIGLSFFHLLSMIISLIKSISPRVSLTIFLCKSIWNCVTGTVLLVGIIANIAYVPQLESCGELKYLNMSYIICEMSVISSVILVLFILCVTSYAIKKEKKFEVSSTELGN